jgi:hypothetical protein
MRVSLDQWDPEHFLLLLNMLTAIEHGLAFTHVLTLLDYFQPLAVVWVTPTYGYWCCVGAAWACQRLCTASVQNG